MQSFSLYSLCSFMFCFLPNSQIFWFGDLNYRLSMLDTDVRKLVALKKWHELMNYDQVRLSFIIENFMLNSF